MKFRIDSSEKSPVSLRNAPEIIDSSDVMSLLEEIRTLSIQNPNQHVVIEYINQPKNLQGMINFFDTYPNLLPQNVTLSFFQNRESKYGNVELSQVSVNYNGMGEIGAEVPHALVADLLRNSSSEQLPVPCPIAVLLYNLKNSGSLKAHGNTGHTLGEQPVAVIPGVTADSVPAAEESVSAEMQEFLDLCKRERKEPLIFTFQTGANPIHPGHFNMIRDMVKQYAQLHNIDPNTVNIRIRVESAPLWYLQIKGALIAKKDYFLRNMFDFDARVKFMRLQAEQILSAPIVLANGTELPITHEVNRKPITSDFNRRPPQLEEAINKQGIKGNIVAIQGYDSLAWNLQIIKNINWIASSRNDGSFEQFRERIEMAISEDAGAHQQHIFMFEDPNLNNISSSEIMRMNVAPEEYTKIASHYVNRAPEAGELIYYKAKRRLEKKIATSTQDSDAIQSIMSVRHSQSLFKPVMKDKPFTQAQLDIIEEKLIKLGRDLNMTIAEIGIKGDEQFTIIRGNLVAITQEAIRLNDTVVLSRMEQHPLIQRLSQSLLETSAMAVEPVTSPSFN